MRNVRSIVSRSSPSDALAELQLGQKWLLILGICLTLVGVGYFLKYSFQQNYIQPPVRVALVYAAGLAALGLGEIFRRRPGYRGFGLSLAGGGVAILYFAGFAGFNLYHLFSHPLAVGQMALVTGLAVALSLVYGAPGLAILGLIGGFCTPWLLGMSHQSAPALLPYLSILNLGILGVAAYRRWKILEILGFALSWTVFLGWFLSQYVPGEFWLTLIFVQFLYVIYAVMPYLRALRGRAGPGWEQLLTLVPGTLLSLAISYRLILEVASRRPVALVSLGYAALAATLAWLLHRRSPQDRQNPWLQVGQAAAMLILTVPLLFDQHWLTIFWSLQGAVLLWVGVRNRERGIAAAGMALQGYSLARYLLHDWLRTFGLDPLHGIFRVSWGVAAPERWITAAVVLGALFWSHRWLKGISQEVDPALRPFTGVLGPVFGLLLLVTLHLELSTWLNVLAPAARFAGHSVLWGVYALGLLLLGLRKGESWIRWLAVAMLAGTLGKVVLLDMARAGTPFRIVSFIGLGLIMILASYLYHRHRDHLVEALGGAVEEVSP